MAELNLETVAKWLKENKEQEEVKHFLSDLTAGAGEPGEISAERINEFLSTEDGQKLIQPLIDKRVTEAVKKRDKYHEDKFEADLKQRLAAEVLKLNPQEEPWQKEIRELREENEREKRERAKDNLKRQMVEEAAKLGIDPFFVDDYVPGSLEQGQLYLQKLQKWSKSIEDKTANSLLSGGYKPGTGNAPANNGGKSIKDLSKLSFSDLVALEESGELDKITTK